MKLKICYAVFAIFAVISSTYAAEETPSGTFSSSLGFATDYRFRGISQTRENPAFQGGVEYNHSSGFKLGVWGSNTDFGVTNDGSIETDVYGSYTWKLASNLTLETGLIGYFYPGSSSGLNYDYVDGYAVGAYTLDPVTFTATFNYSPDNFASSGSAYYPQLGVSVALPHDIVLDGAFGRQWVEDNAAFGLPDYNTWNAGIAYSWQGFTAKLQYVDTSVSDSRCAIGCGSAGIFSLTKKF